MNSGLMVLTKKIHDGEVVVPVINLWTHGIFLRKNQYIYPISFIEMIPISVVERSNAQFLNKGESEESTSSSSDFPTKMPKLF